MDVDGDGDLDALFGTYGGSGAHILMNDGHGNFQQNQELTPGSVDTLSHGVALGDFDGDGDLDAFVANNDESGNRIHLNDGSGSFVPTGQALKNTGNSASIGNRKNRDVVLGDLDGDGDLDAFVANESGSQVFLNQDSPPEVTLPAGGGSYELLKSGDDFVLRTSGGVEVSRAKLGDATQLLIRGSDGDDTLTVDFSGGNPIRVGGLTFKNPRGEDRLVLTGGSATNATHSFESSIGGVVNLDGRTIKYSGVAAIDDQVTATNRAFRFGSGDDEVTLADSVASDGRSRLNFHGGLMTVNFTVPSGTFTIQAGDGDDTVNLRGVDSLMTGTVKVFGEDGNDSLMGLMAGDSLDGGAGNDVLNGRGGNDTLLGGDGLDLLWGGAGHDSVAGGSDNDTLNGQAGNDSLDGGAGNDAIGGDAGHDSLLGGDGDDVIVGLPSEIDETFSLS